MTRQRTNFTLARATLTILMVTAFIASLRYHRPQVMVGAVVEQGVV
jgi:hypothetical protein